MKSPIRLMSGLREFGVGRAASKNLSLSGLRGAGSGEAGTAAGREGAKNARCDVLQP